MQPLVLEVSDAWQCLDDLSRPAVDALVELVWARAVLAIEVMRALALAMDRLAARRVAQLVQSHPGIEAKRRLMLAESFPGS